MNHPDLHKATGHTHSDLIKLMRVVMLGYSNWEPGQYDIGANDIYQRQTGWDSVVAGLWRLGDKTGIHVRVDTDRSAFIKNSKITCINITLEP